MESKDNSNNNPLCPQDNLIATLVVDKSPTGRIQVLSDERVVFKRTKSGRFLPFKSPDGTAPKEELSETAYDLPGSSVVCIGI